MQNESDKRSPKYWQGVNQLLRRHNQMSESAITEIQAFREQLTEHTYNCILSALHQSIKDNTIHIHPEYDDITSDQLA